MIFRFICGLKSWLMLIYEYTNFIDLNDELEKINRKNNINKIINLSIIIKKIMNE